MSVLKIGSQGKLVKELQQLLNLREFSLKVDGDFGPTTEKAVISFQKSNLLKPDGVVGSSTWKALKDSKTFSYKPVFSSFLTKEDIDVVRQDTLNIIEEAARTSTNPKPRITSTLRNPLRQATAMYNNESFGNSISYKAPGQAVQEIYRENKTKPRDEVIALMANKITELLNQNPPQLVSLHCVTEEQYNKANIIDISFKMNNPKSFIKFLSKNQKVTKIISPLRVSYKKHFYDPSEPAIHVEFNNL